MGYGAMKKGKITGELFFHLISRGKREEERKEKERELSDKKAQLKMTRLNRK